jgi:hypothetical protein
VICNFAGAAPWVVFPVGLVEPVELHGIQRGHVGPARGTGGTGVVRPRAAVMQILLRGSTSTTGRYHQNQQNCLQYHRFHGHPRNATASRGSENSLSGICSVTTSIGSVEQTL